MSDVKVCYNCPHFGTPYHHCEYVQEKLNEYEPKGTFKSKMFTGYSVEIKKCRDWRTLWLTHKTIEQDKSEEMIWFELTAYGLKKDIIITRREWSRNMSAKDLYRFVYPYIWELYNEYNTKTL